MIEPEDYLEPKCPFCTPVYVGDPFFKPIDVNRALSKVDECYAKNDLDEAIRVIDYWLREAESGHDEGGELTLRNELMGIYRKLGNKEKAVENVNRGLEIAAEICDETSVSAATVYINAATVYKAFNMSSDSIELFEKAKKVYESNLEPGDPRLGALYNNMALTLTDLKNFAEAGDMFLKASECMAKVPGGEAQQALSMLNLASCKEAELGLEAAEASIRDCVEKAWNLINSENIPRSADYAYACDKCGASMGYYGFFEYAQELQQRAKDIYEGK